jgi:hypothetical protein
VVALAMRAGKAVVGSVASVGVPKDPNERVRLAANAGVAAARRLGGTVARPVLEPLLAAIKVRYGLADIQAIERAGKWWVRATINPTAEEDSGVLVNPADAAQTHGALDLYRGIHLKEIVPNYAELDPDQLREQLIREEDFADAVYTILNITRAQAPTVTLAQRQEAAAKVVEELRNAQTITNVRPWWSATKRANLFLTLLQRFVNDRTALKEELQTKRVKQVSGFKFSDLPFISTTKSAARAAKYAFGTVVATGAEAAKIAASVSRRVLGKVFVYLFKGNDLAALRAADIRYLASQDRLNPHYRFSIADKEITFSGGIPAENRVGEVVAREGDSEQTVTQKAKTIATSQAGSKGGLLPWSDS